jgi:hypothetical protein
MREDVIDAGKVEDGLCDSEIPEHACCFEEELNGSFPIQSRICFDLFQ